MAASFDKATPAVKHGASSTESEPSLLALCARAFALFLGYSALVILFYAGLYAIGEGIYWAITGAWL